MFNFCRKFFVIFIFIGFISSYSSNSTACEPAGSVSTAATGVNSSIAAAFAAAQVAILAEAEADSYILEEAVLRFLKSMKKAIVKKMDWLWTKWDRGLKTMMKEISSGVVEENMDLGTKEDIKNLTAAKNISELQEAKAKRQYQPNNQGCSFDTASKYITRGDEVKKAVSNAYAKEFSNIGSNKLGSATAAGNASGQASRWKIYSTEFCDADSNNGHAGCAASLSSPNPNANKHIMPSKTLFSKYTIDMSNPDNRDAVKELMFNITGYEGADAVMTSAMKSSAGQDQVQKGREYITQMDAVGALIYSIVGERTPGISAPEILALREKIHAADPSANPSKREIRQAIVEQLWDPNYYKELYDAPSALDQKEIYLKAYKLIMLNDLIEKQEKISTVFAVETANLLEKINSSRGGSSSNASLGGN